MSLDTSMQLSAMCLQLFGSLHGMCAHVKKQSVSTT